MKLLAHWPSPGCCSHVGRILQMEELCLSHQLIIKTRSGVLPGDCSWYHMLREQMKCSPWDLTSGPVSLPKMGVNAT